MFGSSYWPRSAVNAYGIAPFSRIHASAHEVSSPPEKAIPTFSPTGSDPRMTPVSSLTLISAPVPAKPALRSLPAPSSLRRSSEVVLQAAELHRELSRGRGVGARDEDGVVARDRAGDVGERRGVDRVGEGGREPARRVHDEQRAGRDRLTHPPPQRRGELVGAADIRCAGERVDQLAALVAD